MNYRGTDFGKESLCDRKLLTLPSEAADYFNDKDYYVWPYYGGYHSLLIKCGADITLLQRHEPEYRNLLTPLFNEDAALIPGDFIMDGQYIPELSTFYASDLLRLDDIDVSKEKFAARTIRLKEMLSKITQQHILLPKCVCAPEDKTAEGYSLTEKKKGSTLLGYMIRSRNTLYVPKEGEASNWYLFLFTHRAYAMANSPNGWRDKSLICTDQHNSHVDVGKHNMDDITKPTVMLVSYTHADLDNGYQLHNVKVVSAKCPEKTEEACVVSDFQPAPFRSAYTDLKYEPQGNE